MSWKLRLRELIFVEVFIDEVSWVIEERNYCEAEEGNAKK